jgi:uncharacterized membrane protein YeaQ/YmgE (transglycosylase-associated protein family)
LYKKSRVVINNYTLIQKAMNIILWIVFGALVGWIASIIMRTDAEQGALLNIVVGVVGAVLGGWLMSLFGAQGVTGFNLYSFVVALVGAVVLIGLVKMVRRPQLRA